MSVARLNACLDQWFSGKWRGRLSFGRVVLSDPTVSQVCCMGVQSRIMGTYDEAKEDCARIILDHIQMLGENHPDERIFMEYDDVYPDVVAWCYSDKYGYLCESGHTWLSAYESLMDTIDSQIEHPCTPVTMDSLIMDLESHTNKAKAYADSASEAAKDIVRLRKCLRLTE